MNTGPDVFPHQFLKRSLKTEQTMFAGILKYYNSVYLSRRTECFRKSDLPVYMTVVLAHIRFISDLFPHMNEA